MCKCACVPITPKALRQCKLQLRSLDKESRLDMMCEGVQIKLPPPYQPLQYACRSRGNRGQGTAVVIRKDAKSLLTLDLQCNIISLDMTLHSCKSSHNVLHLHVLCHAIEFRYDCKVPEVQCCLDPLHCVRCPSALGRRGCSLLD